MSKSKTDRELLAIFSKSDWPEILELAEKRVYRRKFQIIEAFAELVAKHGIHQVTYLDMAKKCKVTRQLVEHHFPDRNALIRLGYRYVYARLQKQAADAIMSREGFREKLRGYIFAVVEWIWNCPHDNGFLMQIYATANTDPKLLQLFTRNIGIGHERIQGLLLSGRDEGFFKDLDPADFRARAKSIQQLLIGFGIVGSVHGERSSREARKQELWRSCKSILGLSH